jgi:hypothetical protein
MLSKLKLAFDRSVRHVDADGHLHVEKNNISKANVCPYYGREIPDNQALGLDPNRVYMLYRHPEELRKAAASFVNKPLLLHHVPVTADEPAKELWVGVVGGPVSFEYPYLKAPLALWTQDGIDAVESEEQRELSPGYRYRADMTRGRTPEGVAFDGIMRDIKGNHVALVKEGRTGPDVMVADETPAEFSKMKFSRFIAALAAIIPSMPAEHAVALDSALAEDMAKDDDLTEDEMKAAVCKYAKDAGKEEAALNDEEKAEAYKRAAADKKGGSPSASVGGKPPHAADEATVKLAIDAAVAEAVAKATAGLLTKEQADQLALDAAEAARKDVHELYTARKAVEATVGVVALDSAEAVFRFALDHLKVEHKDIPVTALAALYEQSAKAAAAPTAELATDSAAGFDPSILGLAHIRH